MKIIVMIPAGDTNKKLWGASERLTELNYQPLSGDAIIIEPLDENDKESLKEETGRNFADKCVVKIQDRKFDYQQGTLTLYCKVV